MFWKRIENTKNIEVKENCCYKFEGKFGLTTYYKVIRIIKDKVYGKKCSVCPLGGYLSVGELGEDITDGRFVEISNEDYACAEIEVTNLVNTIKSMKA